MKSFLFLSFCSSLSSFFFQRLLLMRFIFPYNLIISYNLFIV